GERKRVGPGGGTGHGVDAPDLGAARVVDVEVAVAPDEADVGGGDRGPGAHPGHHAALPDADDRPRGPGDGSGARVGGRVLDGPDVVVGGVVGDGVVGDVRLVALGREADVAPGVGDGPEQLGRDVLRDEHDRV